MTLKEIKSLIKFAKKSGLKSISIGDVSVEFVEHAPTPLKAQAPTQEEKEVVYPPLDPGPSLQQIQEWIHKDAESA